MSWVERETNKQIFVEEEEIFIGAQTWITVGMEAGKEIPGPGFDTCEGADEWREWHAYKIVYLF